MMYLSNCHSAYFVKLFLAGKQQWIAGIVSQGRKDAAQWVTLYDIYTSNDQSNWQRIASGENNEVLRR
jgi:hypothetical protein